MPNRGRGVICGKGLYAAKRKSGPIPNATGVYFPIRIGGALQSYNVERSTNTVYLTTTKGHTKALLQSHSKLRI